MKDFLIEVKDAIKADVQKAWADTKEFASEHPYVALDVGMFAAAGLFYTVLFNHLDRKGFDFQVIKRVR